MATDPASVDDNAAVPAVSAVGRRRPPSPTEQARRVAWGKQAGARVAAEYKRQTEAK